MERRLDTFFYGLFMDADLLRKKDILPDNVRQACVKGMALRIGKRATLVSEPAGCVHGMLMNLSRSELDRLYAEPSVSLYRPEAVIAYLADGAQVAALCYNLPEPPELGQANPEYAAALRDLARRLGLTKIYVDSIQ